MASCRAINRRGVSKIGRPTSVAPLPLPLSLPFNILLPPISPSRSLPYLSRRAGHTTLRQRWCRAMATRGRAAARGRGHGGSWQQRCRATAARGRGSARSSCPVLDGGASMQRRRTEKRLLAVGLDDDAWSSDARRGSVWSCGSGPQALRQRGTGRHMPTSSSPSLLLLERHGARSSSGVPEQRCHGRFFSICRAESGHDPPLKTYSRAGHAYF